MASYTVKLAYRPGQSDNRPLAVVERLDKIFFPGCTREALKDNYWWLVYDEDSEVIGYAGMRLLVDENYAYFTRAAIDKAHRGQGLHKRLIANRIKMAKRLKAAGVVTYVAQHNNASANALISRGFKLYTPQRRWAGTDFLYFSLIFGE